MQAGVCADERRWRLEEGLTHLQLELQALVSLVVWGQGTEHRAATRAASTLKLLAALQLPLVFSHVWSIS